MHVQFSSSDGYYYILLFGKQIIRIPEVTRCYLPINFRMSIISVKRSFRIINKNKIKTKYFNILFMIMYIHLLHSGIKINCACLHRSIFEENFTMVSRITIGYKDYT